MLLLYATNCGMICYAMTGNQLKDFLQIKYQWHSPRSGLPDPIVRMGKPEGNRDKDLMFADYSCSSST